MMDCSECSHMNDLEACRNCIRKRNRRNRHVEVQLKTHTKLKVGDVGVGKTFRLIARMKAYQVIDLWKLFPAVEGPGAVLDPIQIYAVDLATGSVETFSKETEVYLCPMRSIEKDEE